MLVRNALANSQLFLELQRRKIGRCLALGCRKRKHLGFQYADDLNDLMRIIIVEINGFIRRSMWFQNHNELQLAKICLYTHVKGHSHYILSFICRPIYYYYHCMLAVMPYPLRSILLMKY